MKVKSKFNIKGFEVLCRTCRNNRLAITGLFLSESYQGKGIAKYLMNYFEEIANSRLPACKI